MEKRIYTIISALLLMQTAVFGQGIYDALRFSKQYYDGTARSLGMGNAMLSLGGDLGALSYNPAASGIYRYSEMVITPALMGDINSTDYLGGTVRSDRARFALGNVGWVGYFDTGRTRGLKNMNISLVSNQTNNFTSRTSARGADARTSFIASMAANMPAGITGYDMDMPEGAPDYPFLYSGAPWSSILGWNTGLIDTVGSAGGFIGATENLDNGKAVIPGELRQSYHSETSGYIQDVILNLSGNVNDIFYFGVNVLFQSIWYNSYTSYSEEAADPSVFQTGFTGMTYDYRQTTSGFGVGVEAGFIVRPVAGLTIGGSVSTPTWLFLKDNWQESMGGYTSQFGACTVSSPTGSYEYRVTSPFRWSLGAGYVFGSIAAVGIDYERADYSQIIMADSDGNRQAFRSENSAIAATFQAVNSIRAGAEFRIPGGLSLRMGYNYYSSSERGYDDSRHYASAGIGYRGKGGFFIDAAYQQQCNRTEDSYTLYDDYAGIEAPVLTSRYMGWKFLLSIGLRF